jgi:NhaA family Na+:H+ antiporter
MTRPDDRSSSPSFLTAFLATEAAAGVLLVVASVVALVWANSPWQEGYHSLWHTVAELRVGRHALHLDLREWVNEAGMAIFFLVVALEVKRELVHGELRDRRRAALPVAAAVGGMVVPALLYLVVNAGSDAAGGWGVPMATDIAFAVGVLALVAPRIPPAARVFLLTLAIVDDIGAIVVIAVVYSSGIALGWLAAALATAGVLVGFRRWTLRVPGMFWLLGATLWLALHNAGIHATLAGVVLGLAAPAAPLLDSDVVRSRADELLDVFTPRTAKETTWIARHAVSQLEWLELRLHGMSSLVILPLFALANAGVTFTADGVGDAVGSGIAWGIVLGLVVGKPLGIVLGAWVGQRVGVATFPPELAWRHVVGVGALGGIGFTVSLFMIGLAFDDAASVDAGKIGVFSATLLAAAAGAVLLRWKSESRQTGVRMPK